MPILHDISKGTAALWRHVHGWHSTIAFLILLSLMSFAQEPAELSATDELNKSLYETTLYEVEARLLGNPPRDSLLIELLADARQFGVAGDWLAGRDILHTIQAFYDEPDENGLSFPSTEAIADARSQAHPPATGSNPVEKQPGSYLEIETGIDYSLQEFEFSGTEDIDGELLAEELENPYAVLSYYQPLRAGFSRLYLNHRLRIDNHYLNYGLAAHWEQQLTRGLYRLQLSSEYYHNQEAVSADALSSEPDFFDSRLELFWGNPYAPRHRWYVDVRGRMKRYLRKGSISRDINSGTMTASYEYLFAPGNSVNLHWIPGFYDETQAVVAVDDGSAPTAGDEAITVTDGYRYVQHRWGAVFRSRRSFNKFLESAMYVSVNRYENGSLPLAEDGTTSETLYENRYVNLRPELRVEWPLVSSFAVAARGYGELRRYETKDEINSDYNEAGVEIRPLVYFRQGYSIGAGYLFETRDFPTPPGDVVSFAAQGTYRANGLMATAEFLTISGWMVNLEYRLLWRTYPNAQNSLVGGFYSDRRVHTVSLFGWIPLSEHWQLQTFVNYDNDQDRSYERNDNRSTILNLGLSYRF